MSENRYVIWSHEHQSWWRPGRTGYTRTFKDAGLYSRDSALEICTNALHGARSVPNELPVRLDDLQEMQRRANGLPTVLQED